MAKHYAPQYKDPDGTYAALRLGSNWALYGGWIDTWWGAGQDGAMLFSTSARPMPRWR